MSAGVGLVFVLRWFWWRINAWSQLAAMISSLIYTIVFEILYEKSSSFQTSVDSISDLTNLDYYPLKICILTIFVTVTWLIATFLTPPDDVNHLMKFTKATKTGGFWPFEIPKFRWKSKFLLILMFLLLGMLPLWCIWYLKFSSAAMGLVLLAIWFLISFSVFNGMKKLLAED